MPVVRIPTPLRPHAGGLDKLDAVGSTVGEILNQLTTQHPALFARNPEWEPQFDIDGAAAVTTRKTLLDRVAADRMLVTGYHFPFPACGHIVKTATGYEHVPLLWNTAI